MCQRIIQFIRKKTSYYFFKNFIIFLIVFTLFAASVIVITYQNMKQQEFVAKKNSYARIIEKTAFQLNETMKQMSRLSIYVASVYSSNHTARSDHRIDTSSNDLLVPYNVPLGNEGQRIIIMDTDGYFQYFGRPASQTDIQNNLKSKRFVHLAKKNNSEHAIFLDPHLDFWNSHSDFYLFSCVRRTSSLSDSVDKLVWVEQSAEQLNKILQNTADESLMLVNRYGRSIPLKAGQKVKTIPNFLQNNSENSAWFAKNSEGIECYYLHQRLENTDWAVVLEVGEHNLTSTASSSVVSMLTLLIFLYVCIIPIVYFSMRQAAKPLIRLRQQIDAIKFDDQPIELNAPFFNDEVELLNDALQRMLVRVNQAADEKAMMHSREIHASFLALQAQINPHFLFNTLQIFIAMADSKQNAELSTALHTFSNLLRYITTSSPKVVTLKNEIKHIRDYLELMQLCKGNQLEYSIDIEDPSIPEEIYIPRMSLQPIIENAFSHGFSKVFPPWKIQIKIHSDEQHWQIDLANNGAGMNENEIEVLTRKINSFLAKPASFLENVQIGGMGLISSLSRFKSIYKEHFHFFIESAGEQAGFTIYLKIDKDSAYENFNC